MTLAYEDTNSILTDNANRAFQGNMTMQVTQTGSQLWNQVMEETSPDDQKLMQVMAPPGDARITNCWPQAIHIAPSGGQIYNYCK